MTTAWNIYCDESCHLELDKQTHMVMGALACPTSRVKDFAEALRALRAKYDWPAGRELKWTKVSPGGLALYKEYLNLFLREPELHFRAVVIQKDTIDHRRHDQTHDDFYYKMYFLLLAYVPLSSESEQYIYIDIKDTRSEQKVRGLERMLRRRIEDADTIIKRVQHIHSNESELAQLADLLIGAVSYANRKSATDQDHETQRSEEAFTSEAKWSLVHQLRQRTRLSLQKTTSVHATKINLLMWEGAEDRGGA